MTRFPWTSGQVARFYDLTEPQLADRVRRGKIEPAPPIEAGRRLWWPEHVLAAGLSLDRLTPERRHVLLDREARR